MTRAARAPLGPAIALAIAACSSGAGAPPLAPAPSGGDANVCALVDGGAEPAAVATAPTAPADPGWQKGTTHVHARPSGDSSTPVDEVIAWYQVHGYDFIVLTDHNQVTADTAEGELAARAPGPGLLVLAGAELTYNPARCDPPPPLAEGKCRIHVNALAVSARPPGRIEWAPRDRVRRVELYQGALDATARLGGLAQLNHPQWHWGMTGALLTELAGRGLLLVEIANRQFDRWNAGSDVFPSTEALWDQALIAGATLWGIASDDAHDYDRPGRYPAGGGWIMVHAARDPGAIRDAIRAGRFYASTGVSLRRAEVADGALVVEVADDSPGEHLITFLGGGRVLASSTGRAARFALAAAPGYVRAVVRRGDGAQAWVQPARVIGPIAPAPIAPGPAASGAIAPGPIAPIPQGPSPDTVTRDAGGETEAGSDRR